MTRRSVVVVPVKTLERAKGRLAPVLSPRARRELVLEMLVSVLDSAAGSRADGLLVATSDPEVQAAARLRGAELVEDPHQDLNGCLLAGFERCWRRGHSPLYLPADLPHLDALTIDALLSEADERSVVVAPAHDGGTNALLAPPEAPLAPRLGPRSFDAHVAESRRLGYGLRVYRARALELDVDTPADLDAARTLAHP